MDERPWQDVALLTGLRERSQADTLRLLTPHRKRAGITRPAALTHLEAMQLPVYTAIRPLATSLSTSQGKGMMDAEAQCSALMESLETYYAENIPPVLRAQSQTTPALHDYCIPRGHDILYPDDYPHDWVLGETPHGKTLYLPHAFVSMDTTLASVVLAGNSTNGLASGNTRDEAVVHGALELIERIAVKGEGVAVTGIDDHPLVVRLLQDHIVSVTYHPSQYQLPTFKCRLQNRNRFDNQVTFAGHGCHLDKTIALQRALTEAVQSKVTTIAGSRDDISPHDYRTQKLQAWATPKDTMDFSMIEDVPLSGIANITMAKNAIIQRIEHCGEQVLLCPVHQSDIHVVKVFIDAV